MLLEELCPQELFEGREGGPCSGRARQGDRPDDARVDEGYRELQQACSSKEGAAPARTVGQHVTFS